VHAGENATEDRVKAMSSQGNLRQYATLHFAVHGLLDRAAPELSSLVLTRSEPGPVPTPRGRLPDRTAAEVLGLQLDSDLVTLSACQTGLGRIAVGEGVVGLVRAFLFAGGRKVLASLWDVGDTATAVFMMELYRRYRQSRDLVAALSSVKRDFLRGRPFETPSGSQRSEAPFYWAAFVLHGR